MRIVLTFLPTVMVSGRRRLRSNPCWIVIWPKPFSFSVWLRRQADRGNIRQAATIALLNIFICIFVFLMCSREAGRSETTMESVLRVTKVEYNLWRLQLFSYPTNP